MVHQSCFPGLTRILQELLKFSRFTNSQTKWRTWESPRKRANGERCEWKGSFTIWVSPGTKLLCQKMLWPCPKCCQLNGQHSCNWNLTLSSLGKSWRLQRHAPVYKPRSKFKLSASHVVLCQRHLESSRFFELCASSKLFASFVIHQMHWFHKVPSAQGSAGTHSSNLSIS